MCKSADGRGIGGPLVTYLISLRKRKSKLFKIPLKKAVKRKNSCTQPGQSEDFKKLSNSTEYNDDYVILWNKTRDERRLFYNRNDINDIFQKIPLLAKPSGTLLIQADYLVLYPKNPSNFRNSSQVFENIIKATQKEIISLRKVKRERNLDRIKCMNELLQENVTIINEEHKRTVAFNLISYLYKRVNKIPPNSKYCKAWHPEQSLIHETFMIHIKNVKDQEYELKTAFERVRKIHNDHSLKIGPFIVVIGPTLKEISKSFLCITENIRFETSSCTEAVKLGIEFSRCFNKRYSHMSNHIWESLEMVFYGFEYKHPSVAVATVVKKIQPDEPKSKNSNSIVE